MGSKVSQITHGLRSVLNHPALYDFFQDLMGAKLVRQELVSEYLQQSDGFSLLDVGCGTGRLLDALPLNVTYLGFDMSKEYIQYATKLYGDRGTFRCMRVDSDVVKDLPPVDVVVASGLLHHLDDVEAVKLFELSRSALKPGGKFLSIDPVIEQGQNPFARALIDRDRGQNVRTAVEYQNLAKDSFAVVNTDVKHRRWIPYTHCVMECRV